MHLYSSADPVQTARRQTAIAVPSGATATSAGEFSSPAAERVTGASHVGAAFAAAGGTTNKTRRATTSVPWSRIGPTYHPRPRSLKRSRPHFAHGWLSGELGRNRLDWQPLEARECLLPARRALADAATDSRALATARQGF